MRIDFTQRRRVLRGLGLLSAAGLAACATSPIGGSGVCPADDLAPGSLRGPEIDPNARRYPIAIDAHCHIFNARDIPGEGFLLGPVAHDAVAMGVNRELIVEFAHWIAKVVDFLTPTACEELAALRHGQRLTSKAIEDEFDRQLQRFMEAFRPLLAQPRFNALLEQQDEAQRRQRDELLRGADIRPQAAFGARKLTPEFVQVLLLAARDGPSDAQIRELRVLRIAAAVRQQTLLTTVQNLLVFMFRATSPRRLNLHYLRKFFSGAHPPAIDLLCVSMLDFDYWMPGGASDQQAQEDGVLLMEQLAIATGGAFLPLAGYNPLADIETGGQAMARVRTAVEKQGFVGVKVYPPNGFAPYGNEAAPAQVTCGPPPSAHDIDGKLAQLYDWANCNNVPILTHVSHSIGSSDEDEECAHPDGWRKALEKVGGTPVQAGHFGGTNDDAMKEDWSGTLVAIMRTAAGARLHADLAMMQDLFAGGDAALAYAARLVEPLASGGQVCDRVLYGSDFYMTDMNGATAAYAQDMEAFLAEVERLPGAPPMRNEIFGLNAVAFYGLRAPAQADRNQCNCSRDRLQAFYDAHHVPRPRWMDLVDALPS